MGLPPVAFVELAGKLGCRHISLSFGPRRSNPLGHPPFSLVSDAALRRDVAAALKDEDVAISLGEGSVLTADMSARRIAGTLFDPMLELGVERINVVSMDPDLPRTLDEMAMLVELALKAGFRAVVSEFAPVLTIADLPAALAALRHVGRPEFKLLIDTMHLGRTGGTAADLAALDPAAIGYIQLADIRRASDRPYMEEAMTNRLAPGEGELPLREMLAAMPRDLIVGLEIPQLDKLLAGQPIEDVLRSAVAAARGLIASLPPA